MKFTKSPALRIFTPVLALPFLLSACAIDQTDPNANSTGALPAATDSAPAASGVDKLLQKQLDDYNKRAGSPSGWLTVQDRYGYPPIFSLTSSKDQMHLTITDTDPKAPKNSLCLSDVKGTAVEDDNTVVFILQVLAVDAPIPNMKCTTEGIPSPITIDLKQPLGGRTVLRLGKEAPMKVTPGKK